MGRPCFKLEREYPTPLAGVDEAGCAPLAGPVVAAAVILDRDKFPRGIDDSKKLTLEERGAHEAAGKRGAIRFRVPADVAIVACAAVALDAVWRKLRPAPQ